MAGNRVGYLLGPPALIEQARKIGTHTFYNAPTAGQVAALQALIEGAEWPDRARALYQEVGDGAADLLDVPPPEGSTFFFLDVGSRLDDRGMPGLLEDCFEDGVLVAPGESCGRDYADWIRACYTVLPPKETTEAIRRLARRLRG